MSFLASFVAKGASARTEQAKCKELSLKHALKRRGTSLYTFARCALKHSFQYEFLVHHVLKYIRFDFDNARVIVSYITRYCREGNFYTIEEHEYTWASINV